MPLSFRQMMDIPPVWLALAVACAWGQAWFFPMASGPITTTVGGLLVAVGIALIVAAAWEFRRHKTTIIPHLNPDALVTSGVFALSRNPIYLADAVILAGLCLRWGAYPSLLLVPVFVLFIQNRFIRAEEARLRSAFGETFDAYASTVRRWV